MVYTYLLSESLMSYMLCHVTWIPRNWSIKILLAWKSFRSFHAWLVVFLLFLLQIWSNLIIIIFEFKYLIWGLIFSWKSVFLCESAWLSWLHNCLLGAIQRNCWWQFANFVIKMYSSCISSYDKSQEWLLSIHLVTNLLLKLPLDLPIIIHE